MWSVIGGCGLLQLSETKYGFSDYAIVRKGIFWRNGILAMGVAMGVASVFIGGATDGCSSGCFTSPCWLFLF